MSGVIALHETDGHLTQASRKLLLRLQEIGERAIASGGNPRAQLLDVAPEIIDPLPSPPARPPVIVGKLVRQKRCRLDDGEGGGFFAMDELCAELDRQREIRRVEREDAPAEAFTGFEDAEMLSVSGKIASRGQTRGTGADDDGVESLRHARRLLAHDFGPRQLADLKNLLFNLALRRLFPENTAKVVHFRRDQFVVLREEANRGVLKISFRYGDQLGSSRGLLAHKILNVRFDESNPVVDYRFRVIGTTGSLSILRNANDCWTNERSSERHEQSAHCTPSTCAAREWPQNSHRLTAVVFAMPLIGSRTMPKCAVLSPAWSFWPWSRHSSAFPPQRVDFHFREPGRADRGRQERRCRPRFGNSRCRSFAAAGQIRYHVGDSSGLLPRTPGDRTSIRRARRRVDLSGGLRPRRSDAGHCAAQARSETSPGLQRRRLSFSRTGHFFSTR